MWKKEGACPFYISRVGPYSWDLYSTRGSSACYPQDAIVLLESFIEACAALLPIHHFVPSALHTGHCSLLSVKATVPGGACKVGLRRGSGLRPVQLHLLSYSLCHYPVCIGIHPVWVSSRPFRCMGHYRDLLGTCLPGQVDPTREWKVCLQSLARNGGIYMYSRGRLSLSKTFRPSSTRFIPRIFPRGEVTNSH
jgi:hypothetical protein